MVSDAPSVPPSFPQRQRFPRFGAVAAGTLLCPRPVGRSGAALPAYPFPQRQQFPRFGAVAAGTLLCPRPVGRSGAALPAYPFPQRQQFPRFGAVAAGTLSCSRPVGRSGAALPAYPFPQRQRFPRFGAVAESKCAVRHFGRRCGTSRQIGHRKMQFGRVLTGDSRTGPALSHGCIVALSKVYVLRYLLDPLLFAGKQAFYPWSSRWRFLDALIIRCFSKHNLLDYRFCMRGCTPDNSFVILGGVQNTTLVQLKMLPVRMGNSTRLIVMEYTTPIDLPNKMDL